MIISQTASSFFSKTAISIAVLATLQAMPNAATAAEADGQNLSECYDAAIAQCTSPADYDACLHTQFNLCDGVFDLTVTGLSPRQAAKLRLKKHLTVLKIRSRIVALND